MDDLSGVKVAVECLSHRFRKTQKMVLRACNVRAFREVCDRKVTKETNSIIEKLEKIQQGSQDVSLEEVRAMRAALAQLEQQVEASSV
jgi:hypothetical protein